LRSISKRSVNLRQDFGAADGNRIVGPWMEITSTHIAARSSPHVAVSALCTPDKQAAVRAGQTFRDSGNKRCLSIDTFFSRAFLAAFGITNGLMYAITYRRRAMGNFGFGRSACRERGCNESCFRARRSRSCRMGHDEAVWVKGQATVNSGARQMRSVNMTKGLGGRYSADRVLSGAMRRGTLVEKGLPGPGGLAAR